MLANKYFTDRDIFPDLSLFFEAALLTNLNLPSRLGWLTIQLIISTHFILHSILITDKYHHA